MVLQCVQIFHSGFLDFTNIDDTIGARKSQFFHIQGNSAVKLSKIGQIKIFLWNKILGTLAPLVGKACKHIWINGIQNNLSQWPRRNDSGYLLRQLHLTAYIIHKDTSFRRRNSFFGRALFCTRKQRTNQNHHNKTQYNLTLFHYFLLLFQLPQELQPALHVPGKPPPPRRTRRKQAEKYTLPLAHHKPTPGLLAEREYG